MIMEKRILCNTASGGVAVIAPARECIEALSAGGYISCAFHAPLEGVSRIGLADWVETLGLTPSLLSEIKRTKMMPLWLAREWEVVKFTNDATWRRDRSDRRDVAGRWIDALINGGLSELDAVALIAEKDVPNFATAIEIVDASDVPADRTHRDAWRRSQNGGPISIDERRAVEIDAAKLWQDYEAATQQGAG